MLDAGNSKPYQRVTISTFVVRDRRGSFNSVELDRKLEQSIQRTSKSQGGIVGQTRMFAVVVELELIFHESLLIQNKGRKHTNEWVMEHHKTIMYQELRGKRGVIFDAKVSSLFDFVRALANAFIIKASGVRPHTFVTEDFFNDEIMNVFQNGEKGQREGLFLRHRSLQ